ncbi:MULTISPECIES: universal stress protein [Halolamina]|uniref:Nucleotide-binding universal stress protein, UspA family n=1 Tax=Halolamina pelagica TaxID=699431 RepID=A0A1I5SHH3_9EURY|nr:MULTISPECIES: universal stress protein [Halolamina]NHX37057.1 universal stress protein [Halolamina sp. R1-12]SFP70192.1 Nucleotide-binding universal stress protein, UspA family [Halolamina pelagica]
MTFVVPFDGSDLAESALVRATAFDAVFDEGVVAVTVVPNGNIEYARAAGWLEEDESFDLSTIVDRLADRVHELAPDARFRYETVGQYASAGTITKHVRQIARDEDASMVVIGSENAGHLTVSISSIGGGIAADDAYDVLIVRSQQPSKVEKVQAASPAASESKPENTE